MIHFRCRGGHWTSILMRSVTVSLPVFAKLSSLACRDERLKGDNGLSVPFVMSNTKEVHGIGPRVVHGFEGRKVSIKGGPEGGGGRDEASLLLTPAIEPTHEEGSANRPGNSEASGDQWYLYVRFPSSTFLLRAAGGFGDGEAGRRSCHEKSNLIYAPCCPPWATAS